MPKVKVENVVTFSTEDPIHVASNMLSTDPSKKWKCQSPGEKSSSIVLQLEKACIISSIDIGNEHSAYIEVLASRSSNNDDFKVLLTMSSFMSPLEARQSQNINKVRMFSSDQLSKPECEQKWDRIKIVCTQPFNKHVQYGLSFISLQCLDDKESAKIAVTAGKFTLRPASPDILSAGSLFARRKELGQTTPLSAAAAIRQASSTPTKLLVRTPIRKTNSPSPCTNIETDDVETPRSRNRNDILYTSDDDKPNTKIDKLIEKKKKEDEIKEKAKEVMKKADSERKRKDREKKRLDNDEENIDEKRKKKDYKNLFGDDEKIADKKDKASTSADDSAKRKLNTPKNTPNKKIKKADAKKRFSELLVDVTLVISGIQNPDRANLRTLALAMGAKYKADWDNTCSHLICAYRNTPKFNMVKGRGKIVRKEWILDGHALRKRLPWRRYALDKDDLNEDESEEEVSANTDTTMNLDGSDTEDEIERIEAAQRELEKVTKDERIDDEFEADATQKDVKLERDDEEIDQRKDTRVDVKTERNGQEKIKKEITTNNNVLPKLANYFQYQKIYVDPGLNNNDKKLVIRYITAYNGTIVDDLCESFDTIVISMERLFDFKEEYEIQLEDKICNFVSPDWIWECHNNQKLMPMDDFLYC